MLRIPFTLRIDQEERTALEHLSELEGRPINQLLNEAIKIYLGQQSPKEASLEASLSALQKYRKRDPGYRHAIDEFVDWYCSEPRLAFNRIVVLRYPDARFYATHPS